MVDRKNWLYEEFTRKLAEVTGSMVGSAVTSAVHSDVPIPEGLVPDAAAAAEPAPAAAGPAPEAAGPALEAVETELLVWEQSFDVGDDCRMVVAAPGPSWAKIGGEALKAAGVDELDRDSVRGTYLEILSQTLSGLASEIGTLLDRNISATGGREVPGDRSAVSQTLRLMLNGEALTLYIGAEANLLTVLSAAAAEAAFRPGPAGAGLGIGPASGGHLADDDGLRASAAERHEMLDSSKTLDLLLDVELPVSVSFGRASVPLKDVLKLTSGSIVELNRGVTDPVELIVNNCVIARGEVVVVEGNYGVRIQQIISARERLRTLN